MLRTRNTSHRCRALPQNGPGSTSSFPSKHRFAPWARGICSSRTRTLPIAINGVTGRNSFDASICDSQEQPLAERDSLASLKQSYLFGFEKSQEKGLSIHCPFPAILSNGF